MTSRPGSRAFAVLVAMSVSIAGLWLLVSSFRAGMGHPRAVSAGGDSRLVFSAVLASKDGAEMDSEIFVGTSQGVIAITDNESADIAPAWSPDGQRVAFASDRGESGNVDIYVMDRDGSAAKRLTTDPAVDTRPSWSPSGDAIVFARHDGKQAFELWTVTLDGSETRLTNNEVDDFAPEWSPDGTRIAFQRYEGDNLEIFLIDPDGQNSSRVTFLDGEDSDPSWSPDGSAIVFTRDPLEDSNAYLAIQSTAKPGLPYETIQSPEGSILGDPQWLPDGSILSSELLPDHGVRIHQLDPDRGEQVNPPVHPETIALLESAWRLLGIDAWGPMG